MDMRQLELPFTPDGAHTAYMFAQIRIAKDMYSAYPFRHTYSFNYFLENVWVDGGFGKAFKEQHYERYMSGIHDFDNDGVKRRWDSNRLSAPLSGQLELKLEEQKQ